MGKIISIVSQKGGAGKSTVTTLLANILFHHFGLKIAILDVDFPQFCIFKRREEELSITQKREKLQSAYKLLYLDREPYPILRIRLSSCLQQLDKMEDAFDFIFVDLAGAMNQPGILEVYRSINHFFIPALQDNFSLKSAIEFYDFIKKAIQPTSNHFESCHLFFNRIPRRHRIPKVLAILSKAYNILPIFLSNYIIYEKAYRSTLYPIPKAKKEAIKLIAFTNTIMATIQQPANHSLTTQLK